MKKRIIEIVAIIATVSLMVGCAATTSNEKVEDKRPIENAIITEDEVVNPEDNWVDGNKISELDKGEYIQYSPADESTIDEVGAVDKSNLDNECYTEGVTIPKNTKMYLETGALFGYTKTETKANILFKADKWYFVEFKEGLIGYVLISDVGEVNNNTSTNKEDTTTTSNDFTVTKKSGTMYAKSSVNVRKGPGTSYEKIGSLTTNQKVTITGKASNGWYEIDYNGDNGYVSSSYLSETKVEIKKENNNSNTSSNNNQTSNNTNNNASSNNSSNSNNGGTSNNQSTQTPQVSMSAAEVQAKIESACRAHGMVSFEEFVNQVVGTPEYSDVSYEELISSKYDASWFQCSIPINNNFSNEDYYAYAGMNSPAYTIEYDRTDSGYYIFTCYRY